MESVRGVINIVYARIIDVSVRCVRAYIDAGAPRVEPHKADEHPTEFSAKINSQTTHEEVQTFRTIQDILHHDTHIGDVALRNTVMYAGTVTVPLYKNPTIEFDAQIGTIPFGELVMMYEPQGRFFRVSWNGIEGWVLRDDLVDRAIRVHPQFSVGHINSVDDPNTAHVRAILGDIFGLNRSEFSLQAGEYVLYKLWKKGLQLEWPEDRPRVPGYGIKF
jgi:hypothetical protein